MPRGSDELWRRLKTNGRSNASCCAARGITQYRWVRKGVTTVRTTVKQAKRTRLPELSPAHERKPKTFAAPRSPRPSA
jgi:hypothetical protein